VWKGLNTFLKHVATQALWVQMVQIIYHVLNKMCKAKPTGANNGLTITWVDKPDGC